MPISQNCIDAINCVIDQDGKAWRTDKPGYFLGTTGRTGYGGGFLGMVQESNYAMCGITCEDYQATDWQMEAKTNAD